MSKSSVLCGYACSHSLNKFLAEMFIFCALICASKQTENYCKEENDLLFENLCYFLIRIFRNSLCNLQIFYRSVFRIVELGPSGALPFPKPKKTKKKPPEKNSLYFRKRNFLAQILKSSYIFPKRKLFLFFWKRNFPVKILKKIPYTFGTGTF